MVAAALNLYTKLDTCTHCTYMNASQTANLSLPAKLVDKAYTDTVGLLNVFAAKLRKEV